MSKLRITEIFYSLQGESNFVGLPTIFIRLTGCPLRCVYCDTAYAFQGGDWLSFAEIMAQVEIYKTPYITVTGGEPLAQKECLSLLTLLCDKEYLVSLETSGALDISEVDARVIKVVDLKTPASGEQQRNLLSNLDHINERDQLKFVIADNADYQWAKEMLFDKQLAKKCTVLFSPVFSTLAAKDLAQWILQDQLPVRFQLQLHKILWGDTPGR